MAAQAPQLPKLLQCVLELEQRLSPACWSSPFRRLDYDRVSAAQSGNVRDVANAARTRSAATEAISTYDGAAAEDAAQAVLQLPLCIAIDAFLHGIGHDRWKTQFYKVRSKLSYLSKILYCKYGVQVRGSRSSTCYGSGVEQGLYCIIVYWYKI